MNKKTSTAWVLVIFLWAVMACKVTQAPGTLEATSSLPPKVEAITERPITPASTSTVPMDPRGEEAILILQPGPGSRVTSPIHVSGVADPTFEQHLVVSLVLDDGSLVTTLPALIEAEVGQRGPYAVDIPFEVREERQGFIQVYSTSARDGGILHLSSVGVRLAPSGSPELASAQPEPERIAIFRPSLNENVSGGVVQVEGFALASFEQTLLAQVLDAFGNVVGQQPILVNAPDWGVPGPFKADVPYEVASSGPGRLVVRDVSPAFGGDVHVASVEIVLNP